MPSPAASVATQTWVSVRNRAGFPSGSGRVTAVDGAHREAPVNEVAFKVRKGVAVLGENKELGPAVVQLGHLGPSQAVAEGDELALFASGHGGVRLGGQPPELNDLGAKLLDGGGSRDLGRRRAPRRLRRRRLYRSRHRRRRGVV